MGEPPAVTSPSPRLRSAFGSIFEHLAISAGLFNLQGNLVLCNKAYSNLLGYSQAELVGRPALDLTHVADRRRNRVLIQRLAAGEGDSYVLEKRYVHKDGHLIPVQVNVSLFRAEDGTPLCIFGIAVDLSAREDAELARAEATAKSRVLATMSHEIRTPLNSILGFSQLIENELGGSVSERHRRYFYHIRSSGKHLVSLIGDFLELSKLEAGMMPLEVEDVDLAGLMVSCVDEMHSLATVKGLALVVSPVLALLVETDERRLRQILLNLLSNAIKFTDEGSVTLGVDLSETECRISVRDTGVGIAPEDQGRVFGEFTQVRRGRPPVEGTGLGLALSQRLAEGLGGSIELESALGKGSTFTLVIPAARCSWRHPRRALRSKTG